MSRSASILVVTAALSFATAPVVAQPAGAQSASAPQTAPAPSAGAPTDVRTPGMRPSVSPAEAARYRTDTLRRQLTDVAVARAITPCEAYERFNTVRPFDNPMDPWGRKIEFECVGGVLLVRSLGPDGRPKTDDDVVSGTPPPAADVPPPPAPVTTPSAAEPPGESFPLTRLALALAALAALYVVIDDLRS